MKEGNVKEDKEISDRDLLIYYVYDQNYEMDEYKTYIYLIYYMKSIYPIV